MNQAIAGGQVLPNEYKAAQMKSMFENASPKTQAEIEHLKGMGEFYKEGGRQNPLQKLMATEAAKAYAGLPEKERNARALASLPQHQTPEDLQDMATIKNIESAKAKLIEDPNFFALKPEEQAARIAGIHNFFAPRKK